MRTALIGVGRWGKNHLKTLEGLGYLDLIYDADPKRLQQLKEDGYECSSSLEEIWDDASISQVVVATPAPTHYGVVRAALLSEKDVFVEKPLALDAAAGQELQLLAAEKGKILMVGHILLHDETVQHMVDIVRRGLIGEVRHVKSNRLAFGVVRTEESVLWSFAVHDVSIVNAIFDPRDPQLSSLPVSVSCSGQSALGFVEDFISLNLCYPGNRTATINVSWMHPYKHREVVVVGSTGFLIYDALKTGSSQLKIVAAEYPTAQVKESPMPIVDAKLGSETQPDKGKSSEMPLPPLTREHRHFRECCEQRCAPITDGREAVAVLRVLDAAEKSMREGKAVDPAESSPPLQTAKAKDGTSSKAVESNEPTPAAQANDVTSGTAVDPVESRALQAAKAKDVTSGTPYFVHESAYVDKGAVIGEGTKIWHFSHVMGGAVLGEKCNVGQNVYIGGTAKLGRNVKVQNNVSLYDGVICEDNVFVGPSVVFTNVKNPRSEIVRRGEFQTTRIREGASLGANSVIVCGCTVGRYAFVGAGSVVTKDIRPHQLVYGNPATVRGVVSKEGITLTPLTESPDNQMYRDYYDNVFKYREDGELELVTSDDETNLNATS